MLQKPIFASAFVSVGYLRLDQSKTSTAYTPLQRVGGILLVYSNAIVYVAQCEEKNKKFAEKGGASYDLR